jgi:hypothetical protein
MPPNARKGFLVRPHVAVSRATGIRESRIRYSGPGHGDRPKCHQQPFLSLRGASWVWRFTPGGLFYRPKVLPLDVSMKLIARRWGRQQFDRPAAHPLQCCILKPGTSLLASAACGPVLPDGRVAVSGGLASTYPASDWSAFCSGPSWISARVQSH